MVLSLKQVEDVCLYYGDKPYCCRYLSKDGGSFYCYKRTGFKRIIDIETEKEKERLIYESKDPYKEGVIALGDNCPGYIFLKNKLQGYDVK